MSATIILTALISFAVYMAVRRIITNRKNGKCCGCCDSCTGCSKEKQNVKRI